MDHAKSDTESAVSIDLTEAESSPPVSPQLTESDVGEVDDPSPAPAEAGATNLSEWVAGRPLPAPAPSLTSGPRGREIPLALGGSSMPGPLLPPLYMTSPDSAMEEALALPPYDPRRLETIIAKSNEVVTKFESKRGGR